MDYVELKQALYDYLQCDEPTFQRNVETFVRTAERRIYSAIRMPESRASFTGTLNTGTNQLDTPDNFQEPLQFIVYINGTATQLLLKEPSFISEAYPVAASTGPPRYYAILTAGQETVVTILIGPYADADYLYEVRYIRTPPSIVDVTNTWLGDNAHPALLYESLVEAYTFLKGEAALIQLFRDRANESKVDLIKLCEGVQHMDTYRNPELRVSV